VTSHPFSVRSEAPDGLEEKEAGRRRRLSIIIEWANTRLNGMPRAWGMLDAVRAQWQQIVDRQHPASLPADAGLFLDGLDPRAEVLVVAGEVLDAAVAAEIRARLGDGVDVAIHVAEGLEYYPLKNHGAHHASGDLLLFVDSDVWPDDDWLPHLLGSFARTDIDVVCGQTYVAPTDLVARLRPGWRYPLRTTTRAAPSAAGSSATDRLPSFRRQGSRCAAQPQRRHPAGPGARPSEHRRMGEPRASTTRHRRTFDTWRSAPSPMGAITTSSAPTVVTSVPSPSARWRRCGV
jgi:hypothetical protein